MTTDAIEATIRYADGDAVVSVYVSSVLRDRYVVHTENGENPRAGLPRGARVIEHRAT